MVDISVIIPLVSGETAWKKLLNCLSYLPEKAEIIFVTSGDEDSLPDLNGLMHNKQIKTVWGATGRANALNEGAKRACGQHLWFLHADSYFSNDVITNLLYRIVEHPHALHYFDLRFSGNFLMKINSIGGWIRSHVLGIPFGDQGFCISKEMFNEIGGYPEDVPYGEDHLFLWKAKQHRIRVLCADSVITTSSRKYEKSGWLSTTLRHQYMFIKQAVPEFCRLLKEKME
ncbi:MAG: glycosyltransferase [Alphaproteobacteria bacterium]|nr:glycosyltransferase [Alphaproteobacteria bacterium]